MMGMLLDELCDRYGQPGESVAYEHLTDGIIPVQRLAKKRLGAMEVDHTPHVQR